MPDPAIEIGCDGFTVPVTEILTGRGFITGKSGSGKSNTASVVAEQLLEQGFPLLVVDTDGEYWGLKEAYEVLHVGADEECDLQVGPEHAEKIAELALGQGVPIILDVSAYLDESQAKALIRETARHLFAREKKAKTPFLMLVEEIHEYIPETSGLDETGQMLIRVAKRGRKRGLGLCGISQRPADVKKDFITQANWLVWHRLTWDNDTQVVRRVVGAEAAEVVRELDTGEGLIQTDWSDEDLQRVTFRRKETFDAGATPGLEDYDRPDLKSVSSDLVAELEEISEREEQRQDRIAQLEQEVERKTRRIEELEEELSRARDMSDMAQQFTQALSSAGGDGGEAIQEKVDEIRDEKNAQIRELRQERNDLEEALQEAQERNETLERQVQEMEDARRLQEHVGDVAEAARRLAEIAGIELGGDERLRKRVKSLEEKNERLRKQLQEAPDTDPPLQDVEEFLDTEAVQQAIDEAKEETSPKYVKAVIATCLDSDGATYEDIAETLGHGSTSNVHKGVNPLATREIVTKEKEGPNGKTIVHLNTDGLRDIKRAADRRRRRQEMMEEL